MQQETKIGIIGSNVNGAISVAQEVQRVEISNRRRLMEKVIATHDREKYFLTFMKLSNKELKKKSKQFVSIHRYIDGLGLERYYEGKGTPTPTQAHRISVMLNSMIGSKIFTSIDLEKPETDYFHLLVGVYICMKHVTANFIKMYPNDKRVHELNHVSSEIGLRLYSLYVDSRLEDANSEYEEVRLR